MFTGRGIAKKGSFFVLGLLLASSLATPVVMAAAGTTSSSSTNPDFVTAWGGAGSGNGQFVGATGAAVANNGNVYVTDSANDRIQEFTNSGTYVAQWGSAGSGNGQFFDPAYIAIASNGNVYVTDIGNARVQEFTSNGTYVTQWGSSGTGNGQFGSPRGIGIAGNGNVYVADFQNNNVQEFTSSGAYITQWGSLGSGDGQFANPLGLAVAGNGNVYVANANGIHEIQEFTSSGTFITKWGSNGTGNGQFASPQGIAVDQNGDVYVTDPGNHRVQEFTASGTFTAVWGSSGSGNGQFVGVVGVASGSNGVIYTVESSPNDRLQEFNFPQNQGAVTASNGVSVALTLPDTNSISSITSAASITSDSGYNYPMGLINFTFSSTAGATVPVTLVFQSNLKSSQVTARKYNPTTKTYSTIPHAKITATTLNGQPALRLTYNITDGGPLDQDGLANGTIVDPVGLATAVTTPASPDTGSGTPQRSNPILFASALLALVSLVGGIAMAAGRISSPQRIISGACCYTKTMQKIATRKLLASWGSW